MWTFLTSRISGTTTEAEVGVSNPLPVASAPYTASASQTRPNNASGYALGDIVSDATANANVLVFANMGPPGGAMLIHYASLEIDVAAVPSGMAGFRVHLFDAAPTAIADNEPWNLPAADRAKYQGFVEVTTPEDFGDTLFVQNDTCRLPVKLAAGSTTLYGQTETRGAYTPTALAVKKVTLSAVQK